MFTYRPDLDGSIQTGRREQTGVLRVDGKAHDVVAVALVDLDTLPSLLPVPALDGHVITGGEDKRLGPTQTAVLDIRSMYRLSTSIE